ncbi:AbrB/MazE/SpoVT family DNA-binding domain-containing protein [Bacillus sp. AFS040349]|uniref:AbrB/MazE/SpoVT family DNA-binding domain-containing protein n=1 Tax=Bacillus sp. AFS040349 TaxID=2033502 RepID=UPI000BFBD5A8|nr:AbrB/MazE/SpoVT family DNA-binding domain-containing protein [Bacillus sp. AFS040349]PGT80562.1 AbrB family transcriptional regulator [Bacillus sp. AFS040349]
MRSTGIVRKTDQLGRIVIPKEVRRGMQIEEGDPLAIYVDDDKIVLRAYQPEKECLLTGKISNQNLSLLNGKINISPEAAGSLLKELEFYVKS